jgi:predicted acylesterase/phospholipase RssA
MVAAGELLDSAPLEAAHDLVVEGVRSARLKRAARDYAGARADLEHLQNDRQLSPALRFENADDAASARCHREAVAVELARSWTEDRHLSSRRRLTAARDVLAPLVAVSTDPRTLSAAARIERDLWRVAARREYLERAAVLYERAHTLDMASKEACLPHLPEVREWWNRGEPGVNGARILDRLARLDSEAAGAPESGDAIAFGERAARLREDVISLIDTGYNPIARAAEVEKRVAEDERAAARTSAFRGIALIGEAHFGLGESAPAGVFLKTARSLAERGSIDGRAVDAVVRRLTSILRNRAFAPAVEAELKNVLQDFLGGRPEALQAALDGHFGLALSGGGLRASFFHIGVLARLAELDLLRRVECLSCVSGGSIVGMAYYLELRQLLHARNGGPVHRSDYVEVVRRVEHQFLQTAARNIRMRVLSDFADNARMIEQRESRTTRLANVYREELYATAGPAPVTRVPKYFDELGVEELGKKIEPARDNWSRENKVPLVVLNASILNNGKLWQFTTRGMGQAPGQFDDTYDSCEHFPFWDWSDLPGSEAPAAATTGAPSRVRVAEGVAASSCVPGVFEPVSFSGLCGPQPIRLVDGGVYDNQGAQTLLDEGCDVILVSDASQQMSDTVEPPDDAIGAVLRSESIYETRARSEGLEDLQTRLRNHLLRGVSVLHLKRDIPPRLASNGPSLVGGRDGLTPYGVSVAVQKRLAALRTDLDAFAELESCLLMGSGYRMTKEYVARDLGLADVAEAPPSPPGTFRFQAAERHLQAERGDGPVAERVLDLLGIGQHRLFKALRADTQLRHSVRIGAGVAAGLLIGGIALCIGASTNALRALFIAVPLALLGLWAASPTFRQAIQAIRQSEQPWREALPYLGAAAGAVSARIGMWFDRFWLQAGSLDRFP